MVAHAGLPDEVLEAGESSRVCPARCEAPGEEDDGRHFRHFGRKIWGDPSPGPPRTVLGWPNTSVITAGLDVL